MRGRQDQQVCPKYVCNHDYDHGNAINFEMGAFYSGMHPKLKTSFISPVQEVLLFSTYHMEGKAPNISD